MAENRLTQASRGTDMALLLVAAALFARGYFSFSTSRSFELGSYDVTLATCVASFFGVFFPFRYLTRAMWWVYSPILIMFIPLLGYRVNERLSLAVNTHFYLNTADVLFVYVLSGGLWFLLRAFRWKLNVPASSDRTASLQELLAITGIFCVVLVLIPDVFDMDTTLFEIRMTNIDEFLLYCVYGIAVVTLAFSMQPRRFLIIAFLMIAVWFGWDASRHARELRTYKIGRLAVVHSQHWATLAVLIGAVYLSGFRLLRKPNGFACSTPPSRSPAS